MMRGLYQLGGRIRREERPSVVSIRWRQMREMMRRAMPPNMVRYFHRVGEEVKREFTSVVAWSPSVVTWVGSSSV